MLFCLCMALSSTLMIYYLLLFFFFKQKTAYEMRISDWSSDVCSSDLAEDLVPGGEADDRAEQQQHQQRPPEPAGLPLEQFFRGGGRGSHDRLLWKVRTS